MADERITWADMLEMMIRALRELGERDLPVHAAEWMEDAPLAALLSAESACRHYLQHGRWPPSADPAVRMLLRLRCLFVIDCILGKIAQDEVHPSGGPERRIAIYFGPQWLRDRRGWLATRNPDGVWNFPFDPWSV